MNSMVKEQSKAVQSEVKDQNIFIFDMVLSFITPEGLLQTQFLKRSMTKFIKNNNMKYRVQIFNSNQIDKEGGKADVILLTPVYAFAQKEIEEKFPDTPVIPILKKEYGLKDVTGIFERIGIVKRTDELYKIKSGTV